MRSRVAWKSQPPIAPEICGPEGDTGTHVKEDFFSTGVIHAAPTPTGSVGRRSKLLRNSPHLRSAKPSGATYFTFLDLSAACTGNAASGNTARNPRQKLTNLLRTGEALGIQQAEIGATHLPDRAVKINRQPAFRQVHRVSTFSSSGDSNWAAGEMTGSSRGTRLP